MTEHSFYMERAIQLARRGTGFTNPNPLVGAVIVVCGVIWYNVAKGRKSGSNS